MSQVLARVTLRDKSQATIPAEVRAALRVELGDDLEFVYDEETQSVTIRGLRTIAADQAWFWTVEWQAGEAEADQDIAEGRTTVYPDGDLFLSSLG